MLRIFQQNTLHVWRTCIANIQTKWHPSEVWLTNHRHAFQNLCSCCKWSISLDFNRKAITIIPRTLLQFYLLKLIWFKIVFLAIFFAQSEILARSNLKVANAVLEFFCSAVFESIKSTGAVKVRGMPIFVHRTIHGGITNNSTKNTVSFASKEIVLPLPNGIKLKPIQECFKIVHNKVIKSNFLLEW